MTGDTRVKANWIGQEENLAGGLEFRLTVSTARRLLDLRYFVFSFKEKIMADDHDDILVHDSIDPLNVVQLPKGRQIVIYSGATAKTFRIRLVGVINLANTAVIVDGQQVERLTPVNTNIIVDGRKIELLNQRQQVQSVDYFPVLAEAATS